MQKDLTILPREDRRLQQPPVHHNGQAISRKGQKPPVLSPICYSMSAPCNLERSDGRELRSVLESTSPWIVQTQRLSRYPSFACRRLNCLGLTQRSSRTSQSRGSVAAPFLEQRHPGSKTRASPMLTPVSTHRSIWIPRRTQQGLEGRDVHVEDSELS